MIRFILHLYLFLFPHCEMMVSWLRYFDDCNDSPKDSARCYAASDWDYGGGAVIEPVIRSMGLEPFIIKLPFVRSVSCWEPK